MTAPEVPAPALEAPFAETPAPVKKRRSPLVVILLGLVGVIFLIFIGIQFIPVNRINPLVTTQIKWDSPQTEALARQACMDCHSNETVWPWYSYIAPVSWVVYYDVVRGRSQLNLSTYDPANPRSERTLLNRSGDLAYQLGQILAGGSRFGRGGRGEGFNFPNGQFPTRQPGDQGGGGFYPAPGQGQGQGDFAGGFPGGGLSRQLGEVMQNGQMPPQNYLILHPSARLTSDQQQQLLQGLLASLGLGQGSIIIEDCFQEKGFVPGILAQIPFSLVSAFTYLERGSIYRVNNLYEVLFPSDNLTRPSLPRMVIVCPS